MEVKLEAGAKLDLLNAKEVGEVLQHHMAAWKDEIHRGIMFKDFTGQTVNSGATYQLGGNETDHPENFGPREGFAWIVTRLYLSGAGIVPGTDVFSVFKDQNQPSRLVVSGLTRGTVWDIGQFPLWGNQKICVIGASTGTAGAPIVMSGQAIEAPLQLVWSML